MRKKSHGRQSDQEMPCKRARPAITKPSSLAWLHLMVEETACYFCNIETMKEVMYGGLLKKVCDQCQRTCIEEDDDILDEMSEILKRQKTLDSMNSHRR